MSIYCHILSDKVAPQLLRGDAKSERGLATALTAAMRYILKSESFDRRGQGEKLYCIIAGSAVSLLASRRERLGRPQHRTLRFIP
jgi:hypothetical protein